MYVFEHNDRIVSPSGKKNQGLIFPGILSRVLLDGLDRAAMLPLHENFHPLFYMGLSQMN